MRRRENGAGTITADKFGFRAYFTDPQGKRIGRRFKTRQEANMWLTAARNSIFSGDYVAPNEITVGKWAVEYIQTYSAARVRPRTLTRYIQTARHLGPIASVPLQKLSAFTVQKLYNDKKLSGSSLSKIHSLLSAMYKKAVALDLCKKNIMLAVDRPKCQSKEIRIFTKEEIRQLLNSVKNSRYYSKYYPLVHFAVATGARLSEILGLRTKNVKHGYVKIDSSLQYINGEFVNADTKTNAGRRKITISQQTEALLESDSEYVFHTSTGRPYSIRNIERAWQKMVLEAGLEYRNFHCLRHTHATQLLAMGVPVLEVAKRLGHSRPSQTLTLYGHAIPGYDKSIPAKVDSVFFK